MKKNLTRKERLKKRKDIGNVFLSSFQAKCYGARLKYIENGLKYCRFAVSLIRKYGNSVKRNRTKRIAKEILRKTKNRLSPGFDIILIFYPVHESYEERERQILLLFEKAELFKHEFC